MKKNVMTVIMRAVMMKAVTIKSNMNKLCLLVSALFLIPVPAAIAHTGHLTENSVHGSLHTEHIIMFLLIGLVMYTLSIFRDK